jgi:lipoate-protein ligase B
MNATQQKVTEKKLACLNAMYAIVRDWQSGSISNAQMNGRLGIYLTTEKISEINARIYRTISQENLAAVLAEVVGL